MIKWLPSTLSQIGALTHVGRECTAQEFLPLSLLGLSGIAAVLEMLQRGPKVLNIILELVHSPEGKQRISKWIRVCYKADKTSLDNSVLTLPAHLLYLYDTELLHLIVYVALTTQGLFWLRIFVFSQVSCSWNEQSLSQSPPLPSFTEAQLELY